MLMGNDKSGCERVYCVLCTVFTKHELFDTRRRIHSCFLQAAEKTIKPSDNTKKIVTKRK